LRINKDSEKTIPDVFNAEVLFNYSGLNMIKKGGYDLADKLHYTCYNLYDDNKVSFTLSPINISKDYSIINTTLQSD
jgi:hypothetical protein